MNIVFPKYTMGERIADACIHVLGVAASIIAALILVIMAATALPAGSWASVAVYGVGMIAVFGFSAAYNLTKGHAVKAILRRFDQAAIYLKIAGTYTPFAVLKMGGMAAYGLLATVWAVTLFGVILKLAWPAHLERTSYVLYLAQGWVGLFAIGPLTSALPADVLMLILAGGILYTVGFLFHVARRLPYHNAIWHAFVLAASACHFVAVARTVAVST